MEAREVGAAGRRQCWPGACRGYRVLVAWPNGSVPFAAALGSAEAALGRAVARSPAAAITMATFPEPRRGRAEKESRG